MTSGARACPRTAAGLVLALLLAGAAGTALGDEFYRWVDERGRTHYSDSYYSVPPEHRDQIQDIREDFDEQAKPSVVEGLDQRYVPEIPNAVPAQPGGKSSPQIDLSQLQAMQESMEKGEAWEMLKHFPTSWLVGMGFAMVLFLLVMLAIGSMVLKLACRMVSEEPPSLLKGMGICVVQSLVGGAAQGTLQVAVVPQSAGGLIAMMVVNSAVGFLVYAGVLRGMLIDTMGKALLVQLMVILVMAGVGLGLILLVLFFSMLG